MAVYVFLAPGFEEIEAVTIIDYLRRAKLEVNTVAIHNSVLGQGNPRLVKGSHGIEILSDLSMTSGDWFAQGELDKIEAIYLPGGLPGAENLAENETLTSLIKYFAEKKKLVCAMCASPAIVLAKTGILAGRHWTCYPKMNENLDEYCKGEELSVEELMKDSVIEENVPFVFDKNVLTGRGPGTAEQFAVKFVEILCGKETAAAIAKGSCQRGYE